MNERQEGNLGKITGGLHSVKDALVEPILYARAAFWGLEQEVGSTKARTLALRWGSALLVPPDILSLGIILHNPPLLFVGMYLTGIEAVSILGTWVEQKMYDYDNKIGRIARGPRQPRLFPGP